MKTFLGAGQWLAFFIVVLFTTFLLMIGLILVGVDISTAGLLSLSFMIISVLFALVKGYRFFYDNPLCQDYSGKKFFAIPAKHAAIIFINGIEQNPVRSGFYFVFPFFSLVTLKEIVFLGDFSQEIFDNLSDNQVEFAGGISAPVEGVYICRVIDSCDDIIKYALQDGSDGIINDKIASLTRTALGEMSINDARSRRLTVDDIRARDINLFNSIELDYGVEIISIMISDIELSEEEKDLNRLEYESRIKLNIADNTVREMVKIATAEAEVLKLKGRGLYEQVAPFLAAGTDVQIVFAYLAESEKWRSMKASDKAFVIDNGKSVAGMMAALKGLSV